MGEQGQDPLGHFFSLWKKSTSLLEKEKNHTAYKKESLVSNLMSFMWRSYQKEKKKKPTKKH